MCVYLFVYFSNAVSWNLNVYAYGLAPKNNAAWSTVLCYVLYLISSVLISQLGRPMLGRLGEGSHEIVSIINTFKYESHRQNSACSIVLHIYNNEGATHT